MSKFKSHFLSFTLSIVLASSFHTYAMQGWYEDGQDAQGKKKYKNESTGQIKWSSEHLDPQASRPSPTSNVWIAHKYTITTSPTFKKFSFLIVTPEGTHGSIAAEYNDGSPIKIMYIPDNQAIDESRYVQALDLVLDELSRYLISFPAFSIHVDNYHATLGYILEDIKNYEQQTHQPSPFKISASFDRLVSEERSSIKGKMLDSFFMGLPALTWKIMRRANQQRS